MANGDVIRVDQQSSTIGPFARAIKLLDNENATVTGPWVNSGVLKKASVEVFGTFTGVSIQLYGTNQDQPASGYLGQPIGSPITAAGLAAVSELPFKSIRAAVTFTAGSGAVSAYFYGVG
jgi:hypothetical protein